MESVTCLLLEYFIAENPPSKTSQRTIWTIWVEMFDRLPEAENLLLVNTCNPLLLKDFDNPTYSFPLEFPFETLLCFFLEMWHWCLNKWQDAGKQVQTVQRQQCEETAS